MNDIETRNNRDAEAGAPSSTLTAAALAPDTPMAMDDAAVDTDADALTEPMNGPEEPKVPWLTMARDAYSESTSYLDKSLRSQWQRNVRAFNSEHPSGSKYASAAYNNRSKIFRPKTRAAIRRDDAMAAAAFFSSFEVVAVTPEDDTDEFDRAGAAIKNEILNYRLRHTLPWFMLCVGARQTSGIFGCVVSKQWWEFEERQDDEIVTMMNVVDGSTFQQTQTKTTTVKDRPMIQLIPPENFRIAPGADWLDPVNSSPYTIHLQPMFVGDILQRMERSDPKTGQPSWTKYDKGQLIAAGRTETQDQLRREREGTDREDPLDPTSNNQSDWTIVWVREYCMRYEGQDFQYYTVGDTLQLSDPIPVEEVYAHGRPYVMGYGQLEAFKTHPAGKPELGQQLQVMSNEIANAGIDNIRLAVNGRVKIKRDRNINIEEIKRSAAGGAIYVQAMDDVEFDRPPDVPVSLFAEQDRLNNDIDEILGSFSTSSVASNRKLNETVGGMNLLSSSANTIGEFDLRVFTETWVEPVLRQIVRLEELYETDPRVLTICAGKAKIDKYGIKNITDQLLTTKTAVGVSVGMGSTDPNQRLSRVAMVFGAASQFLVPLLGEEAKTIIKADQVANELFGAGGYKDAARFFDFGETGDPRIKMLTDQVQKLTQMLQQMAMQAKQAPEQARLALDREKFDWSKRTDLADYHLKGLQHGQSAAQSGNEAQATASNDQSFTELQNTVAQIARGQQQLQTMMAMFMQMATGQGAAR